MLQPILDFFILKKNVTKFARLQTLKVTYTWAWKISVRKGLFFTVLTGISKLQPKIIYIISSVTAVALL